MDKKRKKIIIIICALALLIIPVTGFSLAIKGPTFLKSLSRIAGDGKHFGHLFIFGNLVILFLVMSIFYLSNYHNLGNKKTNISFFVACCFLEITVLTPYMPLEYPILASIHNYAAYIAIFLLFVSLFAFIMTIPSSSMRIFKDSLLCLNIIFAICVLIWKTMGRTSSFLELLFVTFASDLIVFIIFLLYRNEKKQKHGLLDVDYKIVENKEFNIICYESFPHDDNTLPLIQYDNNIQWNKLKDNMFKKISIEKIFVFLDKSDSKTYIGVNNTDNIENSKFKTINLKEDKWAVFELDNTFYKTKEATWKYINDIFLFEHKYEIIDDIYLESYFVTKRAKIRKAEIWIPIKKINV